MLTRLLICMLILSAATCYAQQWEWVHNSQGSSSLSYTEDVAVDTVREVVYACGYVNGNPNFSEIPNADYSGGDDGFIMKYDLDGNVIWGFLVGGTGNDRINGIEVDQTTGNIFVTGYLVGNSGSNNTSLEGYSPGASSAVTGSNGGQDAFVAMYNMSGQLAWYRVFGGSNLDRGMDIALNSNGVYATGVYTNTIGLNLFPLILSLNNSVNNFIVALDKSTGSNLWDAVQGSGDDDFDVPANTFEVIRTGITADENSVYTVCYFGGTSYRVYNSSDNLVATHSDGIPSDDDFVVTSLSATSGSYNWSVLYDNASDVVRGLDIDNDCDGLYISGTLHNNSVTPGGTVINSPHDNPILSKLSKSTGTEIWVKDFTSNFTHDDHFVGINVDEYGNLFAFGRLRGTSLSSGSDFSFSGGQGYSEPMLARYGTDGTYKSFEVLPSSSLSWGSSVSMYKNEKYAAGGYFNTSVTFGSTATNNTSFNNAFVAFRDRQDPISYISASGDSIFCQSESTTTPTIGLPSGGVFSGPSEVVFVSTLTGEVDLVNSTPGGPYTISYDGFPVFCNTPVAEFEMYIVQDDDATFAFVPDTFCTNETNPAPVISGTLGGSFTSTAGLEIEQSSGEIDLANSTPGMYWVVYTTNGLCPAIDSVEVKVYEAPDASFTYSSNEYCSYDLDPTPSTSMGGTFSSSAGLVINSTSGQIDLSASASGTYLVEHIVINTNCSDTAVFTVTVNQADDATFSYAETYICQNESNPTPTISGTTGGTFSGPSGLIISSSTGEIDAAASTAGGPYWVVYTTLGPNCPSSDSVEVYIEQAPDPSFSFAQSAYCNTETDPVPLITGTAGGTFSSTAGLVINPTTGEIDLSASTPDVTYIVQYISTNMYCSDSSTVSIMINTTEDASFSYVGDHFCQNEPNPLPTITGTSGGTFTGSSGLSISSSGEIYVTASVVGGPYWVVYTTPGATCPSSDSVEVFIEAAPDASFSYTQSAYCDSESNPLPTITGISGGTFSATAGLVINSTTGEIDLSVSTVGGPYTVQYDVSNTYCSNSATFSVIINATEDPSFSYAVEHFCKNEPNPSPTITGVSGGIFSGPSELVINPSSGLIDVAASIVGGPYWVVYTTPGVTCPASDSVQVYVESVPDPSFWYTQTEYCDSDANPVPMISGATGGTFSASTGLAINLSSGEIDLSSSSLGGPYAVQYLVTNTYCSDSTTFDITINATEDASFNYAGEHFCQNESNPVPTITGTPGGTFSGSGGVVVTSSGEIDVVASTVGGPYWVVYTTPGPICPSSDSVEVYIENAPDASFDYGQNSYCQGTGTVILPNETIPGGVYSAPAEVVINSGTGAIDIDASTVGGPYTIERTVSNAYCQKTFTFEITIVGQDNLVSVSYGSGDLCILDGNQTPVIDGLSGGTFSGPSSIDILNASTGEISPSTSVPGGPYYIEYVTSGACPDSLEVSVSVFDVVTAYAGEDQELYFTFNSILDADPPVNGIGEWATTSSATFDDLINPYTNVANLELGENLFIWTVTNGVCPAASDEMIIEVLDVFIPQAVTANGDGKNDYFEVLAPEKSICYLQIFNRWGQLVYENSNYQNDWNGQNSKGEELMSDTYFYTLLIDDSLSYNGYVVLKK